MPVSDAHWDNGRVAVCTTAGACHVERDGGCVSSATAHVVSIATARALFEARVL